MTIYNFLYNEGLSEYTSLTHLLNANNVPTEGEVNIINASLFYSEQHFINIHSRKRELSIPSLNIRSINANYTEF